MSEPIRASKFLVIITEETPGNGQPGELIERLSMRLDGPLDIPHIVAVLGAKKRAKRSDTGRAHKKSSAQPETPQ